MAAPKRSLRTRRATVSAKPASALDAQVWVFDVEGTLVDAVMPTLRCWRGTFELFGHDVSLAELHRLSGMDGKEMLARLLPRVSPTERAEMLNRQGARYREDFLNDVPAFLDVRALFEALKRRGRRIALATDCQEDELKHYFEITGIEDLVDAIACGDDVRRGKPAASVIEIALRRAKAGRKPAVMVGDTPSDAKAARKAGIASIGLLTGHFAEHDLSEAGCAAVFRDPARLLEAIRDDAGAATGDKSAATIEAAL
jgi:phosphoglycolate phosphatase-like HAD superfamily hydrolase